MWVNIAYSQKLLALLLEGRRADVGVLALRQLVEVAVELVGQQRVSRKQIFLEKMRHVLCEEMGGEVGGYREGCLGDAVYAFFLVAFLRQYLYRELNSYGVFSFFNLTPKMTWKPISITSLFKLSKFLAGLFVSNKNYLSSSHMSILFDRKC